MLTILISHLDDQPWHGQVSEGGDFLPKQLAAEPVLLNGHYMDGFWDLLILYCIVLVLVLVVLHTDSAAPELHPFWPGQGQPGIIQRKSSILLMLNTAGRTLQPPSSLSSQVFEEFLVSNSEPLKLTTNSVTVTLQHPLSYH